jgi:Kef-type K+ transport system membrane component KefB
MEGIAILLLGAALGHALSLRLGVPATPLLIVVGVLLARTGLMPVELLERALILGATLLLFTNGIELDTRRIGAQKATALRVGLLQFLLVGLVGFAAALALGYTIHSSAYLALALTASSTLVVVGLLQQRGWFFEPAARLVIGVLLLQDLLLVLLVPALTRVPAGAVAVLTGTLGSLGLVGLAWFVRRYLAPQLERLGRDEELLLIAALAILFAFVGLAWTLDLPVVVGAFLAGVSLARFPVNVLIAPQLGSVTDFFAAIFFTALGGILNPAPFDLLHAALLAMVVILVTPPLVAFITVRFGFSTRAALEGGLLLAQTSELSLVLGLLGMMQNQITAGVFNVIAVVTVATMILTPFLATDRVVWWLVHRYPQRRSDPAYRPESGHVVLLGTGTTGMPLLETVLAAGHEVMVVDDDPAVISRLQEGDIPYIRGDASDHEVLRGANADRARIISSTVRRPQDNRRLLEFARGVPVLVRVFEDEDAEWVRKLGGTPVIYSEAAAEGLLRWYDHERNPLKARAAARAARQLSR